MKEQEEKARVSKRVNLLIAVGKYCMREVL